VSIAMTPAISFDQTQDDIEKTVDYYQVSLRVKTLATEKPRKLIETLAQDIADMVLGEFDVQDVAVDIEKYILPDADFVGVSIFRKK